MVKLVNDDIKLSATNSRSVIEKVQPIKEIFVTRDFPPRGNDLPTRTATSGHNSEPQKATSSEDIEEVVRSLNEHIKTIKRELHFSVDKESGKALIKVVDSETNKVIRQIPNEEAINVARKLVEGTELNLFNEYS